MLSRPLSLCGPHHRARQIATSATLLFAVGATAAACGDDDAASSAGTDVATTVTATSTDPAAPTTAAAGGAENVTVTVKTFDFQPDPLVVPAGTTIVFRNEDKIDHTVTSGTREQPTPDLFDGRLPEQGATFELTLDEPGTYDYFCARHNGPGMTGSIVVE